jgi:mycothiol synthase
VAARQPAGGVRQFRVFTPDTRPGKMVMLEREGYGVIRHFYQMLRTGLDDLPEAPLPAGIEFRPVLPEDYRTIWDANEEAFRDHWGNVPATDEDFARELADPDFNPALWNVAWDVAANEVAGVTINAIPGSNAALGVRRGWVYNLSVRRPWRKRGLGRALLVRSLATLRDAGQTEVMLGVDAENLTGALRLYEGVGFRQAQHMLAFAKAMEPAAG